MVTFDAFGTKLSPAATVANDADTELLAQLAVVASDTVPTTFVPRT